MRMGKILKQYNQKQMKLDYISNTASMKGSRKN